MGKAPPAISMPPLPTLDCPFSSQDEECSVKVGKCLVRLGLIKKVMKLLNLISETQSHIWLHTDLLMVCFILLAHHVFLHFLDGLVNAGMSTTF